MKPGPTLLTLAILLAKPLCFAQTDAPSAGGESAAPTLQDAFRDRFLVGVALNGRQISGRDGAAIGLVKAQFNSITAENAMKWESLHPRQGADGYRFEMADRFVEFGESNGMHLVGHTLVWHSQTPNWVFAGAIPPPEANRDDNNGRRRFGGRRRGYDGPRASREELLERMRDHIHTVVGRYKGKVKAWDVVNEALADGDGPDILRDSLWKQIIGPDYINKAFTFAHEADPDAILRYNDYGLEGPAKRRKLITLIKSLHEQGVPVMAIGSQAHVNVSTSYETMNETLKELASLGLPIHITELDVNSAVRGQRGTGADLGANPSATGGGLVDDVNRRLADAYAGIFRAFLEHRDSVEVVTFWGVNDAVSWRRGGNPLLFDGQNRPKPAFDAVIGVATRPGTERE